MKILITYLTGIGNTILFIPTLRALRQQMPDAIIDIVVRHRASQDILKRVNGTRNIFVFNPHTTSSVMQKMRFVHQLRREHYDVNITVFPSNRVEFNLLSFFIGAKRRIATRYEVGNIETLSFLQNELVEVDPTRHEVEQNLALLTPLNIDTSHAERDIRFTLTKTEEEYAKDVLKRMHITPDDVLVGFHPGCNPEQGHIYRRWPVEHYARLGDRLIEQFGIKILLGFGGPEENALNEEIAQQMQHTPIMLENAPLLNAAAVLKTCRLFVASDSGLMHVATAMNVPTVALSGPIDSIRNAPYGTGHTVIRTQVPCAPCNKYPHFQHGGSYIRCIYKGKQKGYCMQTITVDQVYQSILRNYAGILNADDL